MNVTIFGSGYVGLVTAACFADAGNDVVCVDIDADRVARLSQGEVPFYEPGLADLVKANHADGRLRFTTDAAEGIAHGDFQFIAVGTPPGEDGSADLQYVLAVARTIGTHMDGHRIVITKSTVPVGTCDKVRETITAVLAERGADIDFDVVSNPEFLKEGEAVADFTKPDRIIVGVDNDQAAERMRALYSPFSVNRDKLIVMDVRSSEMTKYAANAMLATKISFMNELSNIAVRLGADIEQVRMGIGSDPRIGYHFIYPGCGYGGSCFPKDVKALVYTAGEVGHPAELLRAVEAVNQRQKQVLFELLQQHFGTLSGRTVALWGLAFKPRTDDMREASSRVLMESLWAAGARVRAFDPVALEETRKLYGDRDDLVLCEHADEACEGADALAIVTEWKQFRSPNFARLAKLLNEPVIVDGRNLYEPDLMGTIGFSYYSIGREAIRASV
ncbi:UDP-glucose/GDP-mannose dehydrogenase family protein [Flagellatimonas centrodinii]|uniref:UDP-glucose dehydrogenase family protein n=1 Tax=Flagellatimonas centrodinii TaxID=2806210 RepID=UPI001FEFC2E5|nr:UDP-glucose/GDP-mannose dehydrogenase family protein [Flagellatimonas centrodinii]ULQ47011.1 UDP-glucose/GDP-mannose dehydrogenase family protein [Flagellatimonas centrodinii]